MRAFLGIAITAEAQAALSILQNAFNMKEQALRWIKPAQMHMTLKFLGEIKEAQKQRLSDCMRSIAGNQACFDAKLDRLGGFPSIDNPKVLWVGISQGAREVGALALAVERTSASFGFKPEEKDFHPHVTLARIESSLIGRKAGEKAKSIIGLKLPAWRVAAVNFYRSTLGPGGPRYEVLEEFPLAGKASRT